MSDRRSSLERLAALLRNERSLLSGLVIEPEHRPAGLGRLASLGPRAVAEPAEYELVVEAVREGYLLHYERSRLIAGAEPDLALLAGDYLYALGLERLAALGDREAVAELSDLISLLAQLHAEGVDRDTAKALWLASSLAVGAGISGPHEGAKAKIRSGEPATETLWSAAQGQAGALGLGFALGEVAAAIDFRHPATGSGR